MSGFKKKCPLVIGWTFHRHNPQGDTMNEYTTPPLPEHEVSLQSLHAEITALRALVNTLIKHHPDRQRLVSSVEDWESALKASDFPRTEDFVYLLQAVEQWRVQLNEVIPLDQAFSA